MPGSDAPLSEEIRRSFLETVATYAGELSNDLTFASLRTSVDAIRVEVDFPDSAHVHSYGVLAEELPHGVIRLIKVCESGHWDQGDWATCHDVLWERFIPPEAPPPSIHAGRAMGPDDMEEGITP